MAWAMVAAAAAASTCIRCASPGPPRSRVRAQATSWAGGAEALVRSGAVKAVRPKDVAEALGGEGFRLLDVRPPWERARAGVRGSVHVPLFVGDDDMGPVTLLKKWVHFGYIRLWTGQAFTKMNDRFVDDRTTSPPPSPATAARTPSSSSPAAKASGKIRLLYSKRANLLASIVWLGNKATLCCCVGLPEGR